jgi:hypothetical protein
MFPRLLEDGVVQMMVVEGIGVSTGVCPLSWTRGEGEGAH